MPRGNGKGPPGGFGRGMGPGRGRGMGRGRIGGTRPGAGPIGECICPQCGAEMKVISFIEDHKVIDKIIAHLKLTFHAERPPPSQFVQKELLMAAEERGEYF